MSRPGDFGTKEKIPMAHLSSLVAIRGLQWEKQGNISVDGFFSPVLTKLILRHSSSDCGTEAPCSGKTALKRGSRWAFRIKINTQA
jgi:hypothetical protein